MAPPVRGLGGSVTKGTGTPTAILKVKTWSVKGERKTSEDGPYVDEDTVYTIPGGRKETAEFECTVPEGGNAGQNAVFTAYEANTKDVYTFTAPSGKVFTFTDAYVLSYDSPTSAEGVQTVKFTLGGGAAAVTQDT